MTSPATRSPRRGGVARAEALARRAWAPPPDETLSDWLDANYIPESGATWRTLPFQKGIADAMADPLIEEVTVLKSARVGFTKLLVGYFAYRIARNPCGILVVQPADEDAEGFSKEDLAPALEATPAVAELIGEPRARDTSNTIRSKRFPGGRIKVVGAHSGRGFRRITVDVVAFDEVDAYPPSAGSEGDQIVLGKKRAHTAPFPKFIAGSSPKLKGASRIEDLWEESDKRDYIVPCPHCDHGQRLRWGGRDAEFGIKWPDGCPADAYYQCAHCHKAIQHHRLRWMLDQGRWVASNDVPGHAGFRIWAAYSTFPAAAWGAIAEEFLRVKHDPVRLQVFVNTVLGETWEPKGESPDEHKLMRRREAYPVHERRSTPTAEPEAVTVVPKEVVVLTSMTDVQLDRLEVGLEGWGLGQENWKLSYHVIYGDPTAPLVWEELLELVQRPLWMERGGVDYVRASCIDTGYAAQSVYGFCQPRPIYRTPDSRRAYFFPVKGKAGTGRVWPTKPTRNTIAKVPIYIVHVDAAKDVITARAREIGEPGPGYIHFPLTFGEDYFRQFTAEQAMSLKDRKGFPLRQWELKPGRVRNESFDIAVGNYAALCGLESMGFDLEKEAARIRVIQPPEPSDGEPQPEPEHAAAPAKKKARGRRRSRSSFMGG